MGSSAAADPNCSEAAAPWLLRSTADSAALTFVLAGFCFLLGFASELLHALAHRGRAEASCSSIRAAAAPLAQLPVAPLAQLPAAAPPPLRPCAATERSAATKPAAGGTAAVKALRAAGEAAWGGRLPVALDDDVYLAALVAKQARDHAADEGYARRKLTAAVRWRMEMAYVAGGEAGAGEAAAASRGGEEFAAAPVATHALVCGVPRVAALLRGDRPEPLLSDAALRAAGRVLHEGLIYLHGRDTGGAPLLWAMSGQLDLRYLGRAARVDCPSARRSDGSAPPAAPLDPLKHPAAPTWRRFRFRSPGRDGRPDAAAFGHAVAVLVEVGIVAARARAAARGEAGALAQFIYVENAKGTSFSRLPLRNALRFAQACISSATVGSPERLKASGIAPSSRINQLLFNLIRSAGFVPDSVADKVQLITRVETMRAWLSSRRWSRLPTEAQIPHFFGGPEPHEVPRTPDGDLDLLAMMRAIADD